MSFSNRQLCQLALRALVVLVLVYAFVAGLRTVSDTDMGWHLATGRYVVQHHRIPSTDVLSFTSAGMPWPYPPFGGVLLYVTYSHFGYAGLSYFCALACLLVAAYLVRERKLPSTALTMLAIPAIASRTSPRADLFSTVFFALFLGELWAFRKGKRTRLVLLPVVMLLWVNLHPGFIAGLAALGAYLLAEIIELLLPPRRAAAVARLTRAWPWIGLTLAATLVNPWGWRLYEMSLYLAGARGAPQGALNSAVYINEFLGIPINSQVLYRLIDLRHLENGNSWLMVMVVVVGIVAIRYRQFAVALIIGAAAFGAVTHARYLALFAITVVIIGGDMLDQISDGWGSGSLERARLVHAGYALLAVVLCGVTVLHITDFVFNRSYVAFRAHSRFGSGRSSWFPERAASFIERNNLPGNLFEEFAVGGFAAWRLGPRYPNYIDGRADRLNPPLFAEEQELMSEDPDSPAWRRAADRWNLNVLLLSLGGFRAVERLNPLAFCQSSDWRPVYLDEVSMVLMRNTQQNRPWIERFQVDCRTQRLEPPASASRIERHDFYIDSGVLLLALQRDREAEDALRQAQTLFPADPNSYHLLANLFTRQQRLAEAEQLYRASLARTENDGAWFELGRLFWMERRFPEAENAFQHAIRLSVQPCMLYLTLGKTELMLHKPQQSLDAFADAEKHSPFRRGGESNAPDLYAQIAEGRAEAYRRLGQVPRAIQYQQQAVNLTPEVAYRWSLLADLYQMAGQVESSAQARQRALALEAQRTR